MEILDEFRRLMGILGKQRGLRRRGKRIEWGKKCRDTRGETKPFGA